jgi:MFS family permease
VSSLAVNPRLLAAFHGLQMTLFPISIMTLFWKHRIGMSMTEILAVQAIFGLTMAIFEFPSGYIADRIGYRRTLMWSSLLSIVGWSVYATADSMALVIVSESILGVSIAMASGCDSALMYESLKELDREDEFTRWNGRVRFWGQTCEGTAALVAGALYVWSPRLPFAMQAVVWMANLAIAWRMVEPARHVPRIENHWRQIRSMVHHAFVENRHLTAVVALTIILGMAAFVPVWLVPLYATGAGLDAAWIGPMWAVANYTVAFGSLFSDRISRTLGLMPTLLLCIAFVAAGYAGLALTYGLFGFAWYFCLTAMRGVFAPALHHEENRLIPSSDRAGFLSLRSLVFRLLFFVIGPIVGIAVDAHGQHPVLAVLGAAMTCLGLAAWWWLRAHSHARR